MFKLYIFIYSRSSIYNHAGLCLGQAQSNGTNELFRPSHLPSSLSSLGTSWVFIITRKLSVGRFIGNGSWSHILLFRRRISQSTRWEKALTNSCVFTGKAMKFKMHMIIIRLRAHMKSKKHDFVLFFRQFLMVNLKTPTIIHSRRSVQGASIGVLEVKMPVPMQMIMT